jgi:hypothetical protein
MEFVADFSDFMKEKSSELNIGKEISVFSTTGQESRAQFGLRKKQSEVTRMVPQSNEPILIEDS